MHEKNRSFATGSVFLQGAAIGFLSFALAELSTPHAGLDSGTHDVMLAQRIGLIFTPAVAVWLGWLQHSGRRMAVAAGIGLVIGLLYFILCSGRNFLAIMVMFPCLLGGGLAVFVGSNRSPILGGLPGRLGKGLLAGFAFGLTYMFLLNVLLGMIRPTNYVREMWKGGLPALTVASGLLLIFMRWAVGLVRVRAVFEETP